MADRELERLKERIKSPKSRRINDRHGLGCFWHRGGDYGSDCRDILEDV
jgi:hypothetical protein